MSYDASGRAFKFYSEDKTFAGQSHKFKLSAYLDSYPSVALQQPQTALLEVLDPCETGVTLTATV